MFRIFTSYSAKGMSKSFDKYQKRRLISSYFSVVLSITLVLFLVGLLGLLVINTKKVADYFKEQVPLTIYLKNNAKEVEINQLQKSLALAEYTKSAQYVSKEDAASELSATLGEDFITHIGDNPLLNSIDVRLKADFVTPELIDEITDEIAAKSFVDEVVYDKPLVPLLNDNVNRMSLWILILSAVFTFIAVLLINSSIRLSVYSNRFTIKTMQMVGATKSFIRKPFVWRSVRLGIIGSVLAIIGVAVALYYLDKTFPELKFADQPVVIAGLFITIFLLGIVITYISTFIATQRFLNLRTEDLYY